MDTVWKFPLNVTGEDVFHLEMPRMARILSLQTQGNIPCIWALVDPKQPLVRRWFRIAGTGHPIENTDSMTFIGTFQIMQGQLVFHIFELPEGLLK